MELDLRVPSLVSLTCNVLGGTDLGAAVSLVALEVPDELALDFFVCFDEFAEEGGLDAERVRFRLRVHLPHHRVTSAHPKLRRGWV